MQLSQKQQNPTLRVIVPCYNTKNMLRLLLKHLSSLPDLALSDVIVVDDGSTDGTSEMLETEFPGVNVVCGDGNLLWTGAIRKGMAAALSQDCGFIFWLNHDCRPDPGSFEKIISVLQDPKTGCVSGWCRIAGYPGYSVNPGFKNYRPLTINHSDESLIAVDGTNGNFVGFRADAVRRVGLPDAKHHPHYGDGPYTIRFSRAGFRVLICKNARADLDYELERRLPPFWRVAVSTRSLGWWLSYYFGSFKSQYHWLYRWNDSRHLRGLLALVSYPKVELQTLGGIVFGIAARTIKGSITMKGLCIRQFGKRWPAEKLAAELDYTLD